MALKPYALKDILKQMGRPWKGAKAEPRKLVEAILVFEKGAANRKRFSTQYDGSPKRVAEAARPAPLPNMPKANGDGQQEAKPNEKIMRRFSLRGNRK